MLHIIPVRFTTFLKVILAISFLQSVSIYCGVGIPVTTLYGPILFFSLRRKPVRYAFLHVLPFGVLMAVWTTLQAGKLISSAWSASFFAVYYDTYILVSIVSLLSYPAFLLFRKTSEESRREAEGEELIRQLCHLGAAAAGVATVLLAKRMGWLIDPEFDPYLVIYGLILFGHILIYRYLHAERRRSLTQHTEKRYQHQKLTDALYTDYLDRLRSSIIESGIYLNANLSLDMVARETQIPKHHLSQMFSMHLGKSFYHFIAEHRIGYALERLSDPQWTIDSLAYECGFNSRTSFNRYFKEFVGCVPSEYRQLMSSPAGIK